MSPSQKSFLPNVVAAAVVVAVPNAGAEGTAVPKLKPATTADMIQLFRVNSHQTCAKLFAAW